MNSKEPTTITNKKKKRKKEPNTMQANGLHLNGDNQNIQTGRSANGIFIFFSTVFIYYYSMAINTLFNIIGSLGPSA